MYKSSVRTRILATTLLAATAGLGGVATGATAHAKDNPTPPGGTCVDRQVKEINGYWWECVNGKWVHLPLRSAGAGKAGPYASTGTMAPPQR